MKNLAKHHDRDSTSIIDLIGNMKAIIHKKASDDRNKFERCLLLVVFILFFIIWLIAAIISRVVFSGLATRAMTIAPNRVDWQCHVHDSLLPIEIVVTAGGLGFVVIIFIIFAVILILTRYLVFPIKFSELLLVTPQQKAADVVIECVDLYFSARVVKRFILTVTPMLVVISLFLYLMCHYSDVPNRSFLLGAYWFIPGIIGIPLFLAVRSTCMRTQKILKRMKMLDTDFHRFLAIRLLWFARHFFVLVVAASTILLLMPLVGATWTRTAEKQMLSSLHTLFTEAPEDLRQVSEDEFAAKWSEIVRQSEENPLGIKHWMGIWPVGWRIIAGAAMCVGAALLLSGILLPSADSDRRNAVTYIFWEAMLAIGISVAITAFCGLMPKMPLGQIGIYVVSSLIAFCITFILSHIVEFGSKQERCPYCGRAFKCGGINCPWCGIWLNEAKRNAISEFLISEGSDIVHHRACPTLRGGKSQTYERLEMAVYDRLHNSFNRCKACKRCLGINPAWEPDPVWTLVRKWSNRVRIVSSHIAL